MDSAQLDRLHRLLNIAVARTAADSLSSYITLATNPKAPKEALLLALSNTVGIVADCNTFLQGDITLVPTSDIHGLLDREKLLDGLVKKTQEQQATIERLNADLAPPSRKKRKTKIHALRSPLVGRVPHPDSQEDRIRPVGVAAACPKPTEPD